MYLERVIKTMKILRISDLTVENLSHYIPIMKQIPDLSLLAFSSVVSVQKVCRNEGNGKILLMVNRCDLGSHVKAEERQRNVASNLAQVPARYLSKLGVITASVYSSTGWVVLNTVKIVLHLSCRDSMRRWNLRPSYLVAYNGELWSRRLR